MKNIQLFIGYIESVITDIEYDIERAQASIEELEG